jgi:hypothetical protein
VCRQHGRCSNVIPDRATRRPPARVHRLDRERSTTPIRNPRWIGGDLRRASQSQQPTTRSSSDRSRREICVAIALGPCDRDGHGYTNGRVMTTNGRDHLARGTRAQRTMCDAPIGQRPPRRASRRPGSLRRRRAISGGSDIGVSTALDAQIAHAGTSRQRRPREVIGGRRDVKVEQGCLGVRSIGGRSPAHLWRCRSRRRSGSGSAGAQR